MGSTVMSGWRLGVALLVFVAVGAAAAAAGRSGLAVTL